jgi:hypothetical protein
MFLSGALPPPLKSKERALQRRRMFASVGCRMPKLAFRDKALKAKPTQNIP